MRTTENAGGIHNLTIDPGSDNLPELLGKMKTGRLVAELMGMGVTRLPATIPGVRRGSGSRGASACFPCGEITIAGNLRNIFTGLADVGRDVEKRGNVRTGSVLVDGMTVAGG